MVRDWRGFKQECDSSSTVVFKSPNQEKSTRLLNDCTHTSVASDGQIASYWKPLITEVQSE